MQSSWHRGSCKLLSMDYFLCLDYSYLVNDLYRSAPLPFLDAFGQQGRVVGRLVAPLYAERVRSSCVVNPGA